MSKEREISEKREGENTGRHKRTKEKDRAMTIHMIAHAASSEGQHAKQSYFFLFRQLSIHSRSLLRRVFGHLLRLFRHSDERLRRLCYSCTPAAAADADCGCGCGYWLWLWLWLLFMAVAVTVAVVLQRPAVQRQPLRHPACPERAPRPPDVAIPATETL